MTDETINEAENDTFEMGEMPASLRAALISSLGGGGTNEAGVHGSVLAQTRDMVEAYIKPDLIDVLIPGTNDTVPGYADHAGVHIIEPEKFDGYREAPRYRKGTAVMTDLPSFIGHVLRYKDDDTMIFAKDDPNAPGLTAVLDYHEEGSHGSPRFGHHRTAFNFPLSPEWKAWIANNGVVMSMTDFAKFIEDRYIEIIPAAIVAGTFKGDEDAVKKFVDSLGGVSKLGGPVDLMRIASGMSVHESSLVSDVVRLQSGEGQVTFQVSHETTDATGERMTVPPAFGVAVPVFRGEQPFCVLARLRYRKQSGKLVLWYELFRHDLTFDVAVNDAVKKVQAETGVPVWKGAPEA